MAFTEGKTCIDCHKGIAHTLPAVEQHIGSPKVAPADPSSPGVVNPNQGAAAAAAASEAASRP